MSRQQLALGSHADLAVTAVSQRLHVLLNGVSANSIISVLSIAHTSNNQLALADIQQNSNTTALRTDVQAIQLPRMQCIQALHPTRIHI